MNSASFIEVETRGQGVTIYWYLIDGVRHGLRQAGASDATCITEGGQPAPDGPLAELLELSVFRGDHAPGKRKGPRPKPLGRPLSEKRGPRKR